MNMNDDQENKIEEVKEENNSADDMVNILFL